MNRAIRGARVSGLSYFSTTTCWKSSRENSNNSEVGIRTICYPELKFDLFTEKIENKRFGTFINK